MRRILAVIFALFLTCDIVYAAMNDSAALKQVRLIWGQSGVISRYLQVGDNGFTYQVGCINATTGRFVVAGAALVSWDAAFAAVDMTKNGPACNAMKLVIPITAVTDGTVGMAYNYPLLAVGGLTPYAWTITAGELPPGLMIVGQKIAGVPAAGGTYTFTLLVADGTQMALTSSITMNVASSAAIANVSINSSQFYQEINHGSKATFTVSRDNTIAPLTVNYMIGGGAQPGSDYAPIVLPPTCSTIFCGPTFSSFTMAVGQDAYSFTVAAMPADPNQYWPVFMNFIILPGAGYQYAPGHGVSANIGFLQEQ